MSLCTQRLQLSLPGRDHRLLVGRADRHAASCEVALSPKWDQIVKASRNELAELKCSVEEVGLGNTHLHSNRVGI